MQNQSTEPTKPTWQETLARIKPIIKTVQKVEVRRYEMKGRRTGRVCWVKFVDLNRLSSCRT
jgi:hypothetical protein